MSACRSRAWVSSGGAANRAAQKAAVSQKRGQSSASSWAYTSLGRIRATVVPLPTVLVNSSLAPKAAAMSAQRASPTPLPPLARPGLVHPVERFGQVGQGLGRDAAAGVGYLQPPAVLGGQATQRNRAARCAGVGGVQHKVTQQVCQQYPVGPHGSVLWAGLFEVHGQSGRLRATSSKAAATGTAVRVRASCRRSCRLSSCWLRLSSRVDSW